MRQPGRSGHFSLRQDGVVVKGGSGAERVDVESDVESG